MRKSDEGQRQQPQNYTVYRSTFNNNNDIKSTMDNNNSHSDAEQTTSLSPIEQALQLAQEEFLKVKPNQTELNNSSDTHTAPTPSTSTTPTNNRNDECHYNYYNTRIELPYEEWIGLFPDLNLSNGQLNDESLRCSSDGDKEDTLETGVSSDLVIDKDNIERVICIRKRLKTLIIEDIMTGSNKKY